MYTVHYCGSSENTEGSYTYRAVGSIPQVLEGARIKSLQVPMLKYKEWIVLIKDARKIVASRAVYNGKLI